MLLQPFYFLGRGNDSILPFFAKVASEGNLITKFIKLALSGETNWIDGNCVHPRPKNLASVKNGDHVQLGANGLVPMMPLRKIAQKKVRLQFGNAASDESAYQLPNLRKVQLRIV